jgi:hemoglobin
MKKIGKFLLPVMLLLVIGQQTNAQESLYKRLGGYDAIAAVTDDFIGRLATDKTLSRFFTASSDDSKHKIRQHIVDQLCNVTGGPCIYIGRTMKDAHKGMMISENDWTITVRLLIESLNKFNVPQKEQSEFLAIVSSVKKDIVEAK